MGTIITGLAAKFLPQVLSKLISVLVAVLPYALIAIAVLWVSHLRTEVATEKARTYQAQQVAQANAEAVTELQRTKALSDRVVADMAKDAERRSTTFLSLRKDILSAANTRNCVGSPPIRALLNGLRKGAPAAPSQGGARQGT